MKHGYFKIIAEWYPNVPIRPDTLLIRIEGVSKFYYLKTKTKKFWYIPKRRQHATIRCRHVRDTTSLSHDCSCSSNFPLYKYSSLNFNYLVTIYFSIIRIKISPLSYVIYDAPIYSHFYFFHHQILQIQLVIVGQWFN